MNTPDELPFSEILTELLDADRVFHPSRLFRLSQLDADSAKKLAGIWDRIPVERRRSLVTDLEAFAADDPLLFFDAVGAIAIDDEDAEVRRGGVELLSLEEEPVYAQRLVSILENDAHFEVRAAAASVLGKFVYLGEIEEIPAELFHQIEDALLNIYRSDPQVIVRRRALEAIAFSSRSDVAGLIEDAFESDDEDWQISALFAMGASADQRWEKQVLSMLDVDSALLRQEAARAAGKLDLKESKPVLFAIAEEDDDDEVRAAAVWALSDIGGDDVGEFIEGLLDEAEDDAEIEYLEEALDNLVDSQMFNDLDLPLFDFDEDDLMDMNEAYPDDEGDD